MIWFRNNPLLNKS